MENGGEPFGGVEPRIRHLSGADRDGSSRILSARDINRLAAGRVLSLPPAR